MAGSKKERAATTRKTKTTTKKTVAPLAGEKKTAPAKRTGKSAAAKPATKKIAGKTTAPKKTTAVNTGKKTVAKKTVTSKPASVKIKVSKIGLSKEYVRSGNMVRVTFKLPKAAAPKAKKVSVVGDFNNWDAQATLMKKTEKGDYFARLDLKPGREYQFRYLINDTNWENDWDADKYVPSPYGGDNSVLVAA